MKYTWIDYSKSHQETVESFLDEKAIQSTGCDEGFEDFYSYWLAEPHIQLNENFWCKVVSIDQKPIGVIAIAKSEQNEFTVSEFIIAPTERKKGHGAEILCELLQNSTTILGKEISCARAVVFPNNIASQKAFQKAGFIYTGAHPDGDAWYYEYVSRKE